MAAARDTLDQLRLDQQFMSNVAAWERLPVRPARHGPLPVGLHPELVSALQQQFNAAPGSPLLYTHQARAVAAALAGENVVVVTSTASGKTLCYNLPVLQTMLEQPASRALYLFPTKALAQDQATALDQFNRALEPSRSLPAAVRLYDGDTPSSQRQAIRREARILLTNPDMLHLGILPHHTHWAAFFENLRWVVVDELHTYRGVFGSHVANLLRRLRRICKFYDSTPRFICTSATIANPLDLAERLLEAPVTLISDAEDGSPQAEKHFVLYNPPVIDPNTGLRRAYTLEAKTIAGRFLADAVQTIVFARARVTTELLLGYLRDEAQTRNLDPATVRGYRGGYLPSERREIEEGLRAGTVRGVVATNALELGVDIGQLGAAIIAGYPGTIASLWQQAGRAGRRSETSAVVFVASGAALDQYVALHPRYIFERSPEHALINPDNLAILVNHLRCALFELPFEPGEAYGAFEDPGELLEILAEMGDVHRSNGTFRWIGDSYPAAAISLRTASDDRVVIQDVSLGQPTVIGEVDAGTAPVLVHLGAVYMHEGRQYVVEELDWEQRRANVRATDVDYYTRAGETLSLEVLDVFEADETRPARRAHGAVLITAQTASYRKIKRYTHETLGHGDIDLPAREFETTAYWLWLAPDIVAQLEQAGVMLRPNDYGPNWQRQRNAARARDGYRCRQCGAPESPARAGQDGRAAIRQHDVHHLRPFREFGYIPDQNDNYLLANELDNLITLCARCHHRLEAARGSRSALGGLAHALSNVAPLHLMCDPRDIGALSESRSRETSSPTITIFDRTPGGIGLSERLYELHAQLLAGVHDLLGQCPCSDGCPACVGPIGAAALAGNLKTLTLQLVETLR